MSVFLLTPDDEASILAAAALALANPLSLDVLNRSSQGVRADDAPEPQEVDLPFGWRLNITCEEQPFGLCFHLSMSSPTPMKTLPGPEALLLVMSLLDCTSLEHHWIEEFREGGKVAGRAVNVVARVPRKMEKLQ